MYVCACIAQSTRAWLQPYPTPPSGRLQSDGGLSGVSLSRSSMHSPGGSAPTSARAGLSSSRASAAADHTTRTFQPRAVRSGTLKYGKLAAPRRPRPAGGEVVSRVDGVALLAVADGAGGDVSARRTPSVERKTSYNNEQPNATPPPPLAVGIRSRDFSTLAPSRSQHQATTGPMLVICWA